MRMFISKVSEQFLASLHWADLSIQYYLSAVEKEEDCLSVV